MRTQASNAAPTRDEYGSCPGVTLLNKGERSIAIDARSAEPREPSRPRPSRRPSRCGARRRASRRAGHRRQPRRRAGRPEIPEAEHEVTLHTEEPVVEKRTVPKERVRDKDVHTDEETVSEDVRRERIDTEGDAEGRR
jgi:uncharacterized protein DUF2382